MNKETFRSGTFTISKRTLALFILTLSVIVILVLLIGTGNNFFWVIPPALFLLLILVLSVERFLLLTVFLVPLSIQLRFIVPDVAADLFLPTEPMLAAIMIIMLFKIFASKEIDKKILYHPVTIMAGSLLGWLFLTSITGTMALVSIKFLISRLWFITGFYLLAVQIFRRDGEIKRYFSAYMAGMTPVAIYYLIRLWNDGVFMKETAYSAIRPFFNDHTALGASLAFCIPVSIYLLLSHRKSFLLKVLRFLQLLLFSAAFILSYSRAAWISMAAASVITFILLLKISWKILVPLITVIIIALITTWTTTMIRLNENRQDSSGDFEKQVQSISNIRTDDSNLERINRWKSALRMSSEKPLFGWGPGTYQFNYAPYQVASEKTKISTNWGEGGNAHSEYLGLLAESGIPGMVIYILLLVVVMKKGIDLFRREVEREKKILLICMIAGLSTYIVHGALNNFLDTDKISALFWGITAVIVSADINSSAEKKTSVSEDLPQ